MPLLFRPKHNYLARLSLLLIAAGAGGGIAGLFVYVRSPMARGMQDPVEQPIQFDHRHHARDVGIDCRFCHQTVDSSPHAGIPSTQLCLNCHSQIWNGSPMLELVRQSFIEKRPIQWVKVHDVPDFVYFNHAIHVNKGVGCVTCHGRVDQMAAVEKVHSMTMSWCLDCHRNPEPHLRPVEEVTNMEWTPAAVGHGADHGKGDGHGDGHDEGGGHAAAVDPQQLGKDLAERYDVHTRISCSTCHR